MSHCSIEVGEKGEGGVVVASDKEKANGMNDRVWGGYDIQSTHNGSVFHYNS